MAAMHVGVVELLRLSSCRAEYFNIKPGAGKVSLVRWKTSQQHSSDGQAGYEPPSVAEQEQAAGVQSDGGRWAQNPSKIQG